MSEHPIDYLYFGPLLMKSNITDEFRLELLRRANRLEQKYNHKLAGHIENEYEFTKEDKYYFIEKIMPYTDRYVDDLNKHMNFQTKKKSCELNGLWINYMKAGEFNPPHVHGDSISFVIYLDVPEEIRQESINYRATHEGPGTIDFMYGESIPDVRNHYNVNPKTGDLFLFNAMLKHWVSPFKSNKTRISMSGNFLLK